MCLKTGRVTKRDALVLATLRYVMSSNKGGGGRGGGLNLANADVLFREGLLKC